MTAVSQSPPEQLSPDPSHPDLDTPPADPHAVTSQPQSDPQLMGHGPGDHAVEAPPAPPEAPGQPYPQPYPYLGYPPPAAYPPMGPPPAPRKQHTKLIIGGVVVLVFVACTGVSTAVKIMGPTLNRSPVATATSPYASAPPARTHGGDLSQYAVAAPTDARTCNSHPTDQNLTLDQAAALSTNPTARAMAFRRYEFQRGFSRCWISNTGTLVDLRLYQFSTAELAGAFHTQDVLANTRGSWGATTDVPGIPGGKSFVKSTLDKDGYAQTLSVCQLGDISVAIATNQLPPASASVSNQILVDEYAML